MMPAPPLPDALPLPAGRAIARLALAAQLLAHLAFAPLVFLLPFGAAPQVAHLAERLSEQPVDAALGLLAMSVVKGFPAAYALSLAMAFRARSLGRSGLRILAWAVACPAAWLALSIAVVGLLQAALWLDGTMAQMFVPVPQG